MAKLGNAAAAIRPKGGGSVKAKVIGGLIVAVIVIIVLFNIFNFASTDTNRIGLHYGGGVVEAKKFKSIIPPGSTNKLIGPGDTLYTYPIDQRWYIIGGDAADTDAADEVTVVSKDNVRLGVRVQVYFTLNRDKDVIKSFHERIGLKTEAYEERGWNDMLQSYFRPQIDRALAAVATNYGWAELYNNESKKATFQTAAAQEFTRLCRPPSAMTTSAGRRTTAATTAASCRSRSRSRRRWTKASSTDWRPSSAPSWPRPPRSRRTSRSTSICSRSSSRSRCSARRATC